MGAHSTTTPLSDTTRTWATLMFTDISGYSAMTQRNEILALQLLEEHRKIIRRCISSHSGREIRTIGDAFFVEFPLPIDAYRCAFAIQTALHVRNIALARNKQIQLRIGLNVGDVSVSYDPQYDLFGHAVNIASRLQSLAKPGEICFSQVVFDAVQNELGQLKLKPELQTLKHIRVKQAVYRLLIDSTARNRPAYSRIRRQFKRGVPALMDILSTCRLPSISKRSLRESSTVIPRIALLPFSTSGTDESEVAFSDGLTDELISGLSRNPGLRVLSKSAVVGFFKEGGGTRDLCEVLKPSYLVEGSLRVINDDMQITVKLISAADQNTLWSRTVITQPQGLHSAHELILGCLNRELSQRQPRLEEPAAIQRNTTSEPAPAAYLHYLKGRHALSRRDQPAIRSAIEYFEKAISIDPEFVCAYASLGSAYGLMAFFEFMNPSEAFVLEELYGNRALQLQPDHAEALIERADRRLYTYRDWNGAAEDYIRAIYLMPGLAVGHQRYANLLLALGRFDEALKEIETALKIDPMSKVNRAAHGLAYFYKQDFARATEIFENCMRSESDSPSAVFRWAHALIAQGPHAAAIAESRLRKLRDNQISDVDRTDSGFMLAYALAVKSDIDGATALLASFQKLPTSTEDLAMLYVALGETAKAITLLKQSVEERKPRAIFIGQLPYFRALRADPAFLTLLENMGFPKEADAS